MIIEWFKKNNNNRKYLKIVVLKCAETPLV